MIAVLFLVLKLMAVCSVSTGIAALLWCRGFIPILATTFAVAACVVLL